MKQDEIIEGNKLIAEFMGGTIMPHGNSKPYPKGLPSWAMKEYNFDTLKVGGFDYHLSFDWLMPAIEKISKIPIIEATEQSDTCYPRTFGMLQDDTGLPMFRFNCCHLYVGETLIEAAWIAVVEFIKMENNLKK